MKYSDKIKRQFWESLTQFQRNQIKTYRDTMNEAAFIDHVSKRLDCFIRVRGLAEEDYNEKKSNNQ